MHFVITSGIDNGLIDHSHASDSVELEAWHRFPGDFCKDVFLHFLFLHAHEIRERFLKMDSSIKVPNAVLVGIVPPIREFGLSLIRDYEQDKRIVNGEQILVLGHVITVEAYRIYGKGTDLKYFNRLLKFLENAINHDEPIYIYFYPDLDKNARQVAMCIKQHPSPITVQELEKCTGLTFEEVNQAIDFLFDHKIITNEIDQQHIRLTHRGYFSVYSSS